jgi:Fic family protein
MTDFYDDPAQMEPLSIDITRPAYGALVGLAHELSEISGRVDAALAPATARSLSELVAGMNCYYSNLIEGHRTLPVDIEQALRHAGKDNEQRNLQSLALAHIEADRWARTQIPGKDNLQSFLLEVHRLFCLHLPDDHLKLGDGSMMAPGEFRTQEVRVGRHLAPEAASLKRFLERYAGVFGPMLEKAGQGGIPALEGIVSSFIAHHRLAWIHPFPDGNGRVARILLDAMLRACRLNRASLWSMSRGFAKTSDEYKAALARADEHRMGDLDGRGNLSERGLAEFCTYALRTAIDQAAFMGRMFDLEQFRFDLKPESAYLYLQAFRMGEIERGEAGRITGLPERTARNVLGALLSEGLLLSDSPKGKIRAGFPVHALGSLLPNLYPAGDVDIVP